MLAVRHWFHEWLAYWSQFLRRPEWARRHWQRIADENPRHPRAVHALAVLAAKGGDKRRSLELIDRQLELAPNDANAWFNRGFIVQAMGDHDAALVAFNRAVGIDPKIDRAWYGMALSLVQKGREREAIAALQRNTELQPMSPYGWYQLARVQHKLGNRDEAARVIRHLSGFEPKVAAQLERETGIKAALPLP
jgi:tetratricopeptide (TPR) repeat protein